MLAGASHIQGSGVKNIPHAINLSVWYIVRSTQVWYLGCVFLNLDVFFRVEFSGYWGMRQASCNFLRISIYRLKHFTIGPS